MSLIKHTNTVSIAENSFTADDETATITFSEGQVVSDDSDQRNGTRYDIDSMVIEFNGSVTADHAGTLSSIIAKTSLFKRGREVVMNAIQFAVKENPLAQIAYDLYKNGYAKDFSIETFGPWPDENGLIVNAKITGLSGVVTGNNKSATVKNVMQNSLATARKNGLDTADAEKALGLKEDPEDKDDKESPKSVTKNKKEEDDMKFVTQKNSRDFAVKVKHKNAAGDEVETTLEAGATLDVSEDQAEVVEKQINDARAPESKKTDNAANSRDDLAEALRKEMAEREQKLEERIKTFEQNMLDKSAVEPEFKLSNSSTPTMRNSYKASDIEKMDWRERTALQIQSLYASQKGNRIAGDLAWKVNALHLEQLQKEGKANNALSLTDIGNFVIAPEMVTEIAGHISNYRPLVDRFGFQETLSLVTSWIERTGEIDMEDVDMEDHGDNEDLKPISKPTYSTHTSTLKEFAAVTPVDASAIRFSAIDVVGDITRMYRTAYDRALAKSIIVRLQKAIDQTGNTVPYDFSSANGGSVGALVSLIRAWGEVAEHTPNGLFIMTENSYLHLLEMSLRAGTNGPLANLFMSDPNGVQRFLTKEYLVVPGDLMPALNTGSGGYKTLTAEGVTATVSQGVFYADPNNFKGRVSGGLNFDMSTEAAYEENGTVKAGYQRDKVVFRGYGYRKSAITLPNDVAGIGAPGIS